MIETWILILWFTRYSSVATNNIEFDTKRACQIALIEA